MAGFSEDKLRDSGGRMEIEWDESQNTESGEFKNGLVSTSKMMFKPGKHGETKHPTKILLIVRFVNNEFMVHNDL